MQATSPAWSPTGCWFSSPPTPSWRRAWNSGGCVPLRVSRGRGGPRTPRVRLHLRRQRRCCCRPGTARSAGCDRSSSLPSPTGPRLCQQTGGPEAFVCGAAEQGWLLRGQSSPGFAAPTATTGWPPSLTRGSSGPGLCCHPGPLAVHSGCKSAREPCLEEGGPLVAWDSLLSPDGAWGLIHGGGRGQGLSSR